MRIPIRSVHHQHGADTLLGLLASDEVAGLFVHLPAGVKIRFVNVGPQHEADGFGRIVAIPDKINAHVTPLARLVSCAPTGKGSLKTEQIRAPEERGMTTCIDRLIVDSGPRLTFECRVALRGDCPPT